MPRKIWDKFYQNLKDAACQLKPLEPYTPWSNAAEQEIKEHKKAASGKLLWSRAPKHLWDDCLELEAFITSKAAYDSYKLDGHIHKQWCQMKYHILVSFVN